MARKTLETFVLGENLADPLAMRDGSQPEMRITRQASGTGSREAPQWHEFLDRVGRINLGKGSALALGTVHVTMVSATEWSQMVAAKYPKIADNRKRLLDINRRYQGDYNQFIARKGRDVLETVFGDIDLNAADETQEEVDGRKWSVGSFAVTRFRVDLGVKDIAFGFSADDELLLREETEETVDYLRGERFDVGIIDHNRIPHATFFKTAAHLLSAGGVRLPRESPMRLQFDEPKAITSQ